MDESDGPPLRTYNLFNELGEQRIIGLSTRFYELLYADENPDHAFFRDQFLKVPLLLSLSREIY